VAPNGAKAATYKGVRRVGQVSGRTPEEVGQVFDKSGELRSRRVGKVCGEANRPPDRPTGPTRQPLLPHTPYRVDDGDYQCPVFFIEAQGSWGGNGSPFCKSSIECLSGERTKAMFPSRGGRLIVTPAFISRSQVS